MIRRKATETKTLTPNFASGNVDVTPSTNKTMTKVTIQKDTDLVASNVKKDVEIHGVTGSYDASIDGKYLVRFIYFAVESGAFVEKVVDQYVSAGGSATAPTIASTLDAVSKNSCALEFVEWNNTNISNIQSNMIIGATYQNAREDNIRKTHAFITVTSGTGLTLPIYFNKSDDSTLTISWGDGSANYTTTSSGNINTTHTYSTAGTYDLTMWISSGTGNYGFGNGSTTTIFIGGTTSSAYRFCLKNLFIGDNVTTLGDYSLYFQRSLSIISIPKNITSIGTSAMYTCHNLRNLVMPNSIITCGTTAHRECLSLVNVAFSTSVTTIGDSQFLNCLSLDFIYLPSSVTTLTASAFQGCSGLRDINIPASVSSFGQYIVKSCFNISNVYLESGLTTTGNSTFSNVSKLRTITIPSTVTTVDNYALEYSGLEYISIPSSVTAINTGVFQYCTRLRYITINRYTAPSTITTLGSNAFSNANSSFRIYVPVGSLSVYQNATNWSSYANQIYEDTAQNRALFGD